MLTNDRNNADPNPTLNNCTFSPAHQIDQRPTISPVSTLTHHRGFGAISRVPRKSQKQPSPLWLVFRAAVHLSPEDEQARVKSAPRGLYEPGGWRMGWVEHGATQTKAGLDRAVWGCHAVGKAKKSLEEFRCVGETCYNLLLLWEEKKGVFIRLFANKQTMQMFQVSDICRGKPELSSVEGFALGRVERHMHRGKCLFY